MSLGCINETCLCNSALGFYPVSSSCRSQCGDGIVAPGTDEQCDGSIGCANSTCLCDASRRFYFNYSRLINSSSSLCQQLANVSQACQFFGVCSFNSSTTASVIRPDTAIELIGNTTAANVTLVVQIQPSVGSGQQLSSGLVIASDCITIEGEIVAEVPDLTTIEQNSEVAFLQISKPECFIDGLNDTVRVIPKSAPRTQDCRHVTARKQLSNLPSGARLLSIAFVVDSSACSSSPKSSNADAGVSPGVIGGSVAAAVVVAVGVVIAVLLYKRRKLKKEKSLELQELYRAK